MKWILLGLVLVILVIVASFIPWSTDTREICTSCGNVRYVTKRMLRTPEIRERNGIGDWYRRRMAASHDHAWIERGRSGVSLFGLSRWQCACAPHPLEQHNSAVFVALERLEKLDLDRGYFKLACSEDIGSTVCEAAEHFPFKGGEAGVREWWSQVEDWAKTPKSAPRWRR